MIDIQDLVRQHFVDKFSDETVRSAVRKLVDEFRETGSGEDAKRCEGQQS